MEVCSASLSPCYVVIIHYQLFSELQDSEEAVEEVITDYTSKLHTFYLGVWRDIIFSQPEIRYRSEKKF